MSDDRFEALRRGDECLSQWQIARHLQEALEEATSHAASCAACRARIAEGRAELDAARLEPIPQALQRPPPKPSWIRWATLAAGACAALLLVVVIRPPQLRTKGSFAINIAIKRDGRVLAEDVPLQSAPALRARDQVRIRGLGLAGKRVARLSGREGTRWDVLYTGALKPSGWLPLALEITPGDNELRLRVCESKRALDDPQADCHQREFALEVPR